jgi:hypothetical protein
MEDAMDVGSVLDKSPAQFRQSVRRLPPSWAVFISPLIFLPFSANLLAQTHLVEVVLEPKIATSLLSKPLQGTAKLEKPEVVEPERMQKNYRLDRDVKDGSSRKEGAGLEERAKKLDTNFLPPQRPIGQVNIDLRPKPKSGNNAVPENLAEKTIGHSPFIHASTSNEMLSEMVFAKSLNHDELFAYQPLYFEEANLERYGRTCGPLQPALSGLRFFATIPSLPYAMTVHNPYKTYTTQWPYEAGWGAPKVKEFRPLEAKPSLVQAGAITGLLFVLP